MCLTELSFEVDSSCWGMDEQSAQGLIECYITHTHKVIEFFFLIIPDLPCLPYPSNFVCSLFVLDQQVPFTVPVHSEMCGIPWKMFCLSGSIAGKETDFVAFSSCHLSIAPLLVMQLHFHPSPFHTCILSGSSLCGSYHAIATPVS